MKHEEKKKFTVVCVELVDVLVTTFMVEGGVVVTLVDVIVVLSFVVSLFAVELLPAFEVEVWAVVRVDDGV